MIKKFLDLGFQPLANKYLTKKDLINNKAEDYYHLEVGFNTLNKCLIFSDNIFSKRNKVFF